MSKANEKHIGRRALLKGSALATVATTLPTLPALAGAARDPLEDIAEQSGQHCDAMMPPGTRKRRPRPRRITRALPFVWH
jgi:hypothetical protein